MKLGFKTNLMIIKKLKRKDRLSKLQLEPLLINTHNKLP